MSTYTDPVVSLAEAGTPAQFAMLLRGLAAMADNEPPETFRNEGVRSAVRHLSSLLVGRAEQSDANDTSEDRP